MLYTNLANRGNLKFLSLSMHGRDSPYPVSGKKKTNDLFTS